MLALISSHLLHALVLPHQTPLSRSCPSVLRPTATLSNALSFPPPHIFLQPQAEGVKASYPKRAKQRDLGAYSEESATLVGMLFPFGPSLQLQKDIGAWK